ncbi:hypothetical protein GGH98_001677 [Coemansia sp. RSA 454]|nr:hypothetical protein J3F82_004835 [Coemansia sp. RSA 637]KAJ2256138.1 hypothetical protein GGH98_001677 [Coemansia sp. RSA 454]
MTLEDTSQRNLDRIGGIVAVVCFGICLVAHVWQWVRHRCHALAPMFFFLILRVVGWLLAFIGAIKDDRLLNKRGYIINSLAFWLMLLSGMLLLARWEATRRNVRWSLRSWGGTGGALILCVVFGALDAAGQITWLNNPEDTASIVMKIAAVGFLALSVIYAFVSLFFNYRESSIYQQPTVRWAFVLSAGLLIVRCVFWMLVALNIVKFEESKRVIFLFCLTTTFEIATAAVWGFLPVARHLRSKYDGSEDAQSTKPISIAEESQRLKAGIAAPPIHTEEIESHDLAHENNQEPSSDDASMHKAAPMHSYSDQATAHNRMSTQPSAYSSYYQTPMPASNLNPWAGASTSSSNMTSVYNPVQQSYAQPGAQTMMVGPQSYMQQPPQINVQPMPPQFNVQPLPPQVNTQPMPPQMQAHQFRPAPLQTFNTAYGGMGGPNGPSISFATPGQSPYMGMPNSHTTFVKTPYPQPQRAQEPPSYIDGPAVAYTADYFKPKDDDSRLSTQPSNVTSSFDSRSTPGEMPAQSAQTSLPVQSDQYGQHQPHRPNM